MAKLPSVPEATYGALERIRRVVLVDFSSLFSPDRSIWTGPNLETLHQLFVQRFDKGEGDFFTKFREQLEGADDDGLQLAAELLYVQQFFTSLTGPEKKLQNVRRVLGWMSRAAELPRWAVDGLALGLSSDQSFNQHRPYHLAWLIEFLLAWHAEADRAALLADPARFRSFSMGVEGTQGAHQPMREAWFHMVLPDDFEPMSSRADKRAILASFRSELGHDPSESIDSDLADIRKALEPRFGSGFNYYAANIIPTWRPARGESGPLPDVSRETVIAAFHRFDAEQRDHGEWNGWETSHTQKYAVEFEGRLYPPKQIVSWATGRARGSFSGGPPTNDYLRDRLFTIQSLAAGAASTGEDEEDDGLSWAAVAERVLRASGSPMTIDQIWDAVVKEPRFHTTHSVPKRALYSTLYRGSTENTGRGSSTRPFVRVAPSTFGLVALGHASPEPTSADAPRARTPTKRELVEFLKRDELLEACDRHDLEPADRRVNDNLIDAIVRSKRVRTPELLAQLSRDRLKEICLALELDDTGREKSLLIERILGDSPDPDEPTDEPSQSAGREAATALAALLAKDLRTADVSDGWPLHGTVTIGERDRGVSIYVRHVGGSSRGNPLERRFQNPSKQHPLIDEPNRYELLFGVWTEQGPARAVIVAFDAYRRMDRSTRFSMFMPLALLEQAADTGYSTHENNRGETLHAFRPENFQRYLDAFLAEETWRESGFDNQETSASAEPATTGPVSPTSVQEVLVEAPAMPRTISKSSIASRAAETAANERSVALGHSIYIRPQVGMYGAFARLNYKPWFALAEFLDNSIQSFLNNRQQLEAEGHVGPLVIDISLDDTELSVTDRAGGIALKDFPRAFSPASPPDDATGLSEFGLGMKAAACWFSRRWSVRTSALGESVERMVTFDIPKISREGVENLPIETAPARESDHFTVVRLQELRVPLRGKTLAKVKEHIASIYRVLMKDGIVAVRMTSGGRTEELTYATPELLEAPYYRIPDAAPVRWFTEFEVDLTDRKVTGWAGVMAVGSHARAGFSVFRRRRLIEGSVGETYKPQAIFGSPNSFASQRVIGEIFVEGFDVTHTKDGIQWGADEDLVLASIKNQIDSHQMPLLDQAEGFRSRRAAASLPKDFGREALNATSDALARHVNTSQLPLALTPEPAAVPEMPSQAPVLQQRSTSMTGRRDGKPWAVTLRLIRDPAAPFFSTSTTSDKDKDVVDVDVNLDHAFSVAHINDNESALQSMLPLLAALALAEKATRAAGGRGAADVRHTANEILRAIANDGREGKPNGT